jgi:tetrahydromethanopterin S-methyltransferase subunit G
MDQKASNETDEIDEIDGIDERLDEIDAIDAIGEIDAQREVSNNFGEKVSRETFIRGEKMTTTL